MDLAQRKANLISAIHAAWGDATYPGDSKLLRHFPDLDAIDGTPYLDYPIPDWRDLLRGRTWQEVAPLFAENYVKEYIYHLTPEAYRYYLPSLLLDLLNPQSAEYGSGDFESSLRPSWTFYDSEDDFVSRMELLTSDQIRVIHEFRRFRSDERDARYGRQVTALEGEELEHNQHDYDFWANADRWIGDFRKRRDEHFKKCARLVPVIRAVWVEATYPGDGNIVVETGRDPFRNTDIPPDDLMLLANVFTGNTWEEMVDSILGNPYLYGQISWLTNEAYRYYLPAYLTALLRADLYPMSLVEDNTGYPSSFALMDKPRFSRNARLKRLTQLTPQQRAIVGQAVMLFPAHYFSQRDIDFWADPETGIARINDDSESDSQFA